MSLHHGALLFLVPAWSCASSLSKRVKRKWAADVKGREGRGGLMQLSSFVQNRAVLEMELIRSSGASADKGAG